MAKVFAPRHDVAPAGVAGTISLNAMPDPFDARDLEYRPRLSLLPTTLDQRRNVLVQQQEGSACTGFAVATMINTLLAHKAAKEGPTAQRKRPVVGQVSAYMLYYLGRRYDEFAGELDVGSSLRGVLKGWFHHGVAEQHEWDSLDAKHQALLDDEGFRRRCLEIPLGAYYRVNPYRLDDIQSAITELGVIVASSAIHDGWIDPEPYYHAETSAQIRLIVQGQGSALLGGHAYAIVGYNEIGFLVHNSWGDAWGDGGFATLPYQDWLANAYDAWVARIGVPKTPSVASFDRKLVLPGVAFDTAPALDLRRLEAHVVNLGNNGRLSSSGKFVSTPQQIERIFTRMAEWHDHWADAGSGGARQIVLYAHGGLVSEESGLAGAQRHLNWWLNNHVYPIYFGWESGLGETLLSALGDTMQRRAPVGAFGFDAIEGLDRLAELLVRGPGQAAWAEMKENARAASGDEAMAGGTLVARRLKAYAGEHPGKVQLHLVGHSAGAIFHAALLDRLINEGVPVTSLILLAPALTVADFQRDVAPHIAGGKVGRLAVFVLSDRLELDDVCAIGGLTTYRKSLLYLVSRGFERLGPAQYEVPLLGMERFLPQATVGGAALPAGGQPPWVIVAPSSRPSHSRSDVRSHGGFDDDSPTMTSVLLRLLGEATITERRTYRPDAALEGAIPPLSAAGRAVWQAPPELSSVPTSGSRIVDEVMLQGWWRGRPTDDGGHRPPEGGAQEGA